MEFDFAANETVEDLNKVPEDFRAFYAQQDGKYTIADTFKACASAYDGLNKSLRATRKDFDAFKRSRPDMSGYTALGTLLSVEGEVTADSLKAGIESLLDKVSKGESGKVNWDKMKRDLETAHAKALEGKDGDLKKMQRSLERYLVDSEAIAEIAKNKGVPEFLLPQIKARTKVVLDGENYVVRVVDDAGDPRGNSSGGFMGIADLVKELKADKTFGRAFESDAPSGSGTPPGSTTTRQPQQQRPLNPTDRIARGLSGRR